MKLLIVNADDFGASHGINRGIIEAHRRGVVTSTSMMVTTPWSEEAAQLAVANPTLSVGLHADLSSIAMTTVDDSMLAERCRSELTRQFLRFASLVGRLPTHLDSHHNVHRDARLLPCFREVALQFELPLREQSEAKYFSHFYGQWGGETHLEQISVDGLLRMLDNEIGEGVTELGCHPGYVDADLQTEYAREREAELRTLCDPAVREALRQRGIQLVSFALLRQAMRHSVN